MSSDEEGDQPLVKKQRLFYGSLEEQEKERLEREEKERLAGEELLRAQGSESSESDSSDDEKIKKVNSGKEKKKKDSDDEGGRNINKAAIKKAIKAGNINITDGDTLEMKADVSSERQQELMAEFEKRKMLRSITVSTDDYIVKAKLRELGHPICLFGEGPAQRRDRLKDLLLVFEQLLPGFTSQHREEEKVLIEEEKVPNEIWYHEGPLSLYEARLFIANYSIPRTRDRLRKTKEDLKKLESVTAAKVQEVHRKTQSLVNFCSQIGDNRPLSYCQFSPDSSLLATSSWSGLCKLWSVPEGNEIRVLRGHNERVGGIIFHPRATIDLDPSLVNMVSCSVDGSVQLWNLQDEEPLGKIDCHDKRVSSVAFHPSGRFLGTTCFDKSWRLWDFEKQVEVLHQEGHAQEVFKICFQVDGSLAATCGLDARGLIWDLRTGRNIFALDGHLKKVLAIDFHSNGFQLATGSEDQKCMIWDLRKQEAIYTIPAHNNLVSHLKFCDNILLTSSYDGLAKVWSYPSWAPLKTLAGHEQKVTCVDVSGNGNYVATCSFDRTFKLWGAEFLV
ncbi:U4/U6 small nuclear ribonucleoprotein Prp4-like [Hydra vulgaris]|uniref:U4/U6 small nuclear ribonucleoprotein Prp4-like n=1 Tax=Hydra vulgaris TaxID=6087 RepID=A0ABM4BVU5_HYDVU